MLFLQLYHLLKQTHINPGVRTSLLTNKSVTTILDKIKWNSKPPSPQIKPQMKDEAVRRVKTRHFPILDLGGRGGSRFSIYFVQGCRLLYPVANLGHVFRD